MRAALVAAMILAFSGAASAQEAPEPAPHINCWLIKGTYPNDAADSGFERDWICETGIEPREGMLSEFMPWWTYFDGRLFSRNYDDYQDLRSYFRVMRGESTAAKVVYAHTYVHAPEAREVHLRLGADNAFKAWGERRAGRGEYRRAPGTGHGGYPYRA